MGQLVFQATAGGQTALVGPNPSTNFSLNVPAVNGNLVTTGDTGTVTSTMLASSVYTTPGTIGSGTPNTGAFTSLSATSFTNTGTDTATKFIPTGSSVVGNGLYLPATNALGLSTNGTNALYIDSSQNVGIGTSSPSTKLAVAGTLGVTSQSNFVTGVGSPNMTIGNTANGDTGFIMSWLSTSSASVKNWQWTFNNYSNGMSLLSSATSGSSSFSLSDTLWNVKDAGQQTITDKASANTSAFKFLSFVSNSAEAGSITRVAQTSAVTYNTTSDYRLKNNQAPLTGSGEFIDALKPKTWEWVGGGKATGFIAHEFAEVSPSSVSGEKDATQEEEYIDSSGVKATRIVPLYQGMQASSSEVIANLVAEIQSLRKRVAILENK